MREPLETGAVKVLHTLQQHGFEAYLVGGCVRDKMLQRPVKDYDIATSARPEQVQQAFERTIPTGLQHGTVTVVMDGSTYEVTTFRKEEAYEQHRRPTEVQYIDNLLEDLRRRDFTMNAMALDANGKLIDPFGGMNDMRQGVLRCVGEPDERFEEDALRMLRCIRFGSEYGLRIEEKTWASLCRHAFLLKHIAMERVRMEMERMIGGAAPDKAMIHLIMSGLLHHTKVPLELARLEEAHEWQTIGELASAASRWAYLYLHLAVDATETEEELKHLTFSKQQTKEVVSIIAAIQYLREQLNLKTMDENAESDIELAWKLAALKYGKETLSELHAILLIKNRGSSCFGFSGEILVVLLSKGLHWLGELNVTNLSELQITGKDILAQLKLKAGPWMSAALQHLLEQTALGRVENVPESLLDEVKHWAVKQQI